jgi:hypothetical protein
MNENKLHVQIIDQLPLKSDTNNDIGGMSGIKYCGACAHQVPCTFPPPIHLGLAIQLPVKCSPIIELQNLRWKCIHPRSKTLNPTTSEFYLDILTQWIYQSQKIRLQFSNFRQQSFNNETKRELLKYVLCAELFFAHACIVLPRFHFSTHFVTSFIIGWNFEK